MSFQNPTQVGHWSLLGNQQALATNLPCSSTYITLFRSRKSPQNVVEEDEVQDMPLARPFAPVSFSHNTHQCGKAVVAEPFATKALRCAKYRWSPFGLVRFERPQSN